MDAKPSWQPPPPWERLNLKDAPQIRFSTARQSLQNWNFGLGFLGIACFFCLIFNLVPLFGEERSKIPVAL
jgi:hypothetical protein